MIVAGIEGTAWNFGISIYNTEKNEFIENKEFPILDVYLDPKLLYKIHYSHVKEIVDIIKKNKIDLLCYSYGPGFTRNLKLIKFIVNYCSIFLSIKFLKVHHGLAHLVYSSFINNTEYEGLGLYLSGGNSQIINITNILQHKIIGETIDIAVGNAFDKFGRKLNLLHPCGPKIENYANKTKKYIILPVHIKGMYFSFSGTVSAAFKLYLQNNNNLNLICRSLLLNCFSVILEALERAIYLTGKRKIIASGGVLQNNILKNMLIKLVEQNKCQLYTLQGPENSDNPRMIAITGFKIFEKLNKTEDTVFINSKQRIDENKF